MVASQGSTNKPAVISLRFMPSAYFYQNRMWLLPKDVPIHDFTAIIDTNSWTVSPKKHCGVLLLMLVWRPVIIRFMELKR